METARKRIIDFIENQRIKPNVFLEKTGLKKGFVDKSHQKSAISDTFLSKILEAYPILNPEWLLTGKGPMLKESYEKTQDDLIAAEPLGVYGNDVQAKTIEILEQSIKDKDKIIKMLEDRVVKLEEELMFCRRSVSKSVKSTGHTS